MARRKQLSHGSSIRLNNGDYYYPGAAYPGCQWCRGRGCLACPKQEEDDRFNAAKPIFTADLNNPEEVEQLKNVFGAQALEKAFGPGGGGVQEIKLNAAVAMLTRLLRRTHEDAGDSEANATEEG
jgi:hypothetical protein